MTYDKAPVPVDPDQWPEARGFQRIYNGNPQHQARFVMALFGFRQDLLEWSNNEDAAKAIETVIRVFHDRHPEFMQDGFLPDSDFGTGPYHMDDRLKTYMAELGKIANDGSNHDV